MAKKKLRSYENFVEVMHDLFGVTTADRIGSGSDSIVWSFGPRQVLKLSKLSPKGITMHRLMMRDQDRPGFPIARIIDMRVLGRTDVAWHWDDGGPQIAVAILQERKRAGKSTRPEYEWEGDGVTWVQFDDYVDNFHENVWIDTARIKALKPDRRHQRKAMAM